jgi:hypothetical protein
VIYVTVFWDSYRSGGSRLPTIYGTEGKFQPRETVVKCQSAHSRAHVRDTRSSIVAHMFHLCLHRMG